MAESGGPLTPAPPPSLSSSSIVRLNVGGMRFATTAATLGSRGENMLTRMLATDVNVARDETGALFLDRSGRLFELVLEFLRTGRTDLLEERMQRAFEEELAFYCITGEAGEVSDAALRAAIRNRNELRVAQTMEEYPKQAEFVIRHLLVDLQIRADEGALTTQSELPIVFVAEQLDEREEVSRKFLRALMADDKVSVICVPGIDTAALDHLCRAIVTHLKRDYRLTLVYTLERRIFRFKWTG